MNHETPGLLRLLHPSSLQERSLWSLWHRTDSWGSESDASLDPDEDSQARSVEAPTRCKGLKMSPSGSPAEAPKAANADGPRGLFILVKLGKK